MVFVLPYNNTNAEPALKINKKKYLVSKKS